MWNSIALSPNLFKNFVKNNQNSCATCQPSNANNSPKAKQPFNHTSTWSLYPTIPLPEPKTFSNQVEYLYIPENTIHTTTTHVTSTTQITRSSCVGLGMTARSITIDLIYNFMATTTFKLFSPPILLMLKGSHKAPPCLDVSFPISFKIAHTCSLPNKR